MSRTNPRFVGVEGKATNDYRLGAVGGSAGGYGRVDSARMRRRISQVVLYALLIIGALIVAVGVLGYLVR